MQSFGVQDQTEKETVRSDGEDVIENPAVSKGVMEADFGDFVFPALVEKFHRRSGPFVVVEEEKNGDGNIYFLNHVFVRRRRNDLFTSLLIQRSEPKKGVAQRELQTKLSFKPQKTFIPGALDGYTGKNFSLFSTSFVTFVLYGHPLETTRAVGYGGKI